jgi:hypothetical protein
VGRGRTGPSGHRRHAHQQALERHNGGLIHIDCFVNDHPEAGEGMDLARVHGEALRDGDDWM